MSCSSRPQETARQARLHGSSHAIGQCWMQPCSRRYMYSVLQLAASFLCERWVQVGLPQCAAAVPRQMSLQECPFFKAACCNLTNKLIARHRL
jgi:hypothetical protein